MSEIVENLVSVITPVFNRPEMLRQSVESVLAQTWRSFEVIISDDGSTDGTPEVGRRYERDLPGIVRYIWNPNRGAGPAREAGRQLARGEFIQYLDSDDTLWPRKFEVQIAALRARPECGAAYGYIRLCPENAPPIDKPHKWSGRELPTLFPWLLVDRWWNTDCPLWRRTVCDAIGPWIDLRYSQDWDYDARAGALGIRLVHCPEFVCDQRHHEGNRQTGHGKWLAPLERGRFFAALHRYACAAGVSVASPEMKHFSRWVFAHARQSALLGEIVAARALFDLALDAAGRPSFDMAMYGHASRLFGWTTTARMAEGVRRLSTRKASGLTQRQSWMETDVDQS